MSSVFLEEFLAIVTSFDVGTKALAGVSIFVSLVFSGSLGALWESINNLQIMTHMTMFSGLLPQNVIIFE